MPLGLKSSTIFGLFAGITVPTIATRVLLQPLLIDAKFEEINRLKHDLDFLGWKVRSMEQNQGIKNEDAYTPISYLEGHC